MSSPFRSQFEHQQNCKSDKIVEESIYVKNQINQLIKQVKKLARKIVTIEITLQVQIYYKQKLKTQNNFEAISETEKQKINKDRHLID